MNATNDMEVWFSAGFKTTPWCFQDGNNAAWFETESEALAAMARRVAINARKGN